MPLSAHAVEPASGSAAVAAPVAAPAPAPEAAATAPAGATAAPSPSARDAAAAAPAAQGITNVFTDTDIREVYSELASQAGISIIVDDSVKPSNISVEFKNDTVPQAIEKVALFSGLVWKERTPGVYIVSSGTPDSPLFREFTVSRRYTPQNQSAETVAALLSASYKPYVSVDKATNVIGITAPEQLMDRIMEDVRAMDAPSRQFVVEALIAELTADSGKDFGFSWNWNQFGVDDNLTLGYAKATHLDIARLKALITDGTATLRANPRISAFEGRPATLNVGTETYFSILTGNVNFPTSQIQVIRTGVTLTVTGFIGDDGYITLNLSPEVGDFAASVDGNPTVTVRRATTNIRVKSGETIVIGGLIQDGSIKNTSKVPILGDIPIVGKLFTRSSTSKRRTDVVMMITPIITEDGAGLAGSDGHMSAGMLQTSVTQSPAAAPPTP
jgi:type IV pilus assembly protein PilQ